MTTRAYRAVAGLVCLMLCLGGMPRSLRAAESPDISGIWSGVIQFPDVKLRLVFRLQAEGGSYRALMDSVDQGARDIPVDAFQLTGRELKMQIKAVNATFSGTVNQSGSYITGKWEHKGHAVDFNLERTEEPVDSSEVLSTEELDLSRAAANQACGVWEGVWHSAEMTNQVWIKIWKGADGRAKATLDSFAQKILNLPVRRVLLSNRQFSLEAPGLGASYHGTISPDANAIAGEWKKGETATSVTFKKLPPPKPGKQGS